ncbi:uncharacterized protein LOC661206 [Tribolium castaneum]|uniref:uncharacterized protein LOC661206 n=1 Tax=Tribolium castaneum TaxID=7070 RepID=UPI00046C0FA4|nr:PREDICTED: uncharacterized protein LOC661206 isoform X1 [Tribolium castaneum]|eukprot:XP_976377.2 PREDICTED: uncharacterized protein LOC661206 isoform X1 [Tribolium castaneum]
MQKVLVLVVTIGCCMARDCVTGITCPTSREIVANLEPQIKEIRAKIATVLKSTGDTLASTRLLIRNNISNAKNLSGNKLQELRRVLNQARIESALARPKVRACINNQNSEIAKIVPGNYLSCEANFSDLMDVRNDIIKLRQIGQNLVLTCTHLNPLGSERINLRICLEGKIKDLGFQLLNLEKEFTNGVKNLVNYSTSCVVETSGKLFKQIGAIEGAIRNCKYFS